MKKSKQLLIAVVSGCKPGHEIYEEVLGHKATADEVMGNLGNFRLARSDLFSSTLGGKTVFEYPEIWDNLDKLVELIRRNGEEITARDFTKTIVDDRSALKWAENLKKLDKLFSPALWKGRMAEMEDMWLNLSHLERSRNDFTALRRAVAKAEGRELRDDKLRRMGIEPEDLRDAIIAGGLGGIADKLAANRDHLCKRDLFTPDEKGEIVLDNVRAWNHFPEIHAILAVNGEGFEVQDFLKRRDDNETVLSKAVDGKKLDRIFHEKVWKGRPDQMLALYQEVPEKERSQIDIGGVLDRVLVETYGAAKTSIVKKSELTTAFNGSSGRYNFTPLLVKPVWENMASFRRQMAQRGEKLSLSDLRTVSGFQDNGLRAAARHGHFDQVLAIARETGEALSVSDLTGAGADGTSVIDWLADHGQVALIMEPEMWVGRTREMLEVWDKVPAHGREDIDLEAIHREVNRLSLREKFAPRRDNSGPGA